MRNIAILGSTGSIGMQSVEVVLQQPEHFKAVALTCNQSATLLIEQAKKTGVKFVGIRDKSQYQTVKDALKDCMVFSGEDINTQVLEASKADTVMLSVVGFSGLKPLIYSIEHQLRIAIANKESIVCGGKAISKLAKKHQTTLYPVDSEHSAIFQCLNGNDKKELSRILLTCSGGPFRKFEKKELQSVTAKQALHHPVWEMGNKITIDSATLANKGLEVLEAQHLFDVPVNQIETIIHPQGVVHSMVEYIDHSILAQMSVPDMKGAIQYALGYPKRLKASIPQLDLYKAGALTFEKPDTHRFPALALAYEAAEKGGSYPIAFNAANDIAVNAFLKDAIGFYDIPKIIEHAMHKKGERTEPKLEDIFEIDKEIRNYLKYEMEQPC